MSLDGLWPEVPNATRCRARQDLDDRHSRTPVSLGTSTRPILAQGARLMDQGPSSHLYSRDLAACQLLVRARRPGGGQEEESIDQQTEQE